MSKVYEAHLDKLREQEALDEIYFHQDQEIDHLKNKIDDLKLRLKESHHEIQRLEAENDKLRDRIDVYNAHYDNGRV